MARFKPFEIKLTNFSIRGFALGVYKELDELKKELNEIKKEIKKEKKGAK